MCLGYDLCLRLILADISGRVLCCGAEYDIDVETLLGKYELAVQQKTYFALGSLAQSPEDLLCYDAPADLQ